MFTLLSPENAFNPPLGMLSITSIEAVLPPRLPAATEGGEGEGEDGSAAGEEERWGCFITVQSQGESQTSHLCRNLTSPHWNFRSDFFVLDKEGSIDLSVHDSKDEKGRSMRFVGVTTISIQDIIQEFLAEHAKSGQGIEDRMIDRWFKLEESKAALSRQGRKRIMLDKARLRLQLRWFPRVAASVEVALPRSPSCSLPPFPPPPSLLLPPSFPPLLLIIFPYLPHRLLPSFHSSSYLLLFSPLAS